MDLRKIKALIELLEKSSLSELEIKEGEETVRLARHAVVAAAPVVHHVPAPAPVAAEAAPRAISGPSAEAVGKSTRWPCRALANGRDLLCLAKPGCRAVRQDRSKHQSRRHHRHYRSDENVQPD